VIEDPLAGLTIGRPDGFFLIAEWADEGETNRERPIAPLHLHRSEDEAWYVLEGRLGFRVGKDEVEVRPGGLRARTRGRTTHVRNGHDEPTRYLLVMGPLTARLIEAIHAMSPFDPARLPALFEEYDSELLV
jgi:mannose-6-phosphate isomerase-like protein (cupin superfamily)